MTNEKKRTNKFHINYIIAIYTYYLVINNKNNDDCTRIRIIYVYELFWLPQFELSLEMSKSSFQHEFICMKHICFDFVCIFQYIHLYLVSYTILLSDQIINSHLHTSTRWTQATAQHSLCIAAMKTSAYNKNKKNYYQWAVNISGANEKQH